MKYPRSCKSHPRNACVACLVAQVEDIERNGIPDGPDIGKMSHEERDRHLFGFISDGIRD